MTHTAQTRFSRKTVAIAVALVIGIGGWLVSHPSQAAQEKDKEKAKAPTVLELSHSDLATVEHGYLTQPVALSGTLSPVKQTLIGAEVEGIATEVLVRNGESVKAGQLLARLDTRELRDRVTASAANLERARAELKLAEKDRLRSTDLLKQHFISPNSHDATESKYAVAQAQVKAEEAQLALAQKSLDHATLRAPFAGVIYERHVDVGSRVAIGQKLFGLVDLHDLEFEAKVALAELPAIKAGQAVSLRVEGFSSRSFTGRVERIAPMADNGTRMVPVYIRLKNDDGQLRGGMFAQGEVAVAAAETDHLPLSALRGLDGKAPYVLAVENGKLVEHKVQLGLINQISKTAAIGAGLKVGTKVVAAKLDNIKAGQQVKLPDDTHAGEPAKVDAKKAG
ncbi:efflux RND transporter periplasmic adaptor subunit [Chitinimonas sp.]|uniref:efflux RND transporter periplasmic adaptor subunit n=1 Tax=Chitinimonas sp. TaxID=1934313 RepID=UPI0035B0D264